MMNGEERRRGDQQLTFHTTKTPEEPVPKDFRLIVIIPEEVEQLGAGDGTLLTWTATAQPPQGDDAVEGEWVRTGRSATVNERTSKL